MICNDARHAGRSPRRLPGGFTLIELLATIAIISVLISILLPALSGARKSSRGLLCQTRLRSQGQAMMQYADAHESDVPLGETANLHYAAALLPGLGRVSMNAVADIFRRSEDQEQYLDLLAEVQDLQCPDFPNQAQRLDYVVNAYSRPYTLDEDAGPPGDGPEADPTDERSLFVRLTRLKRSPSTVIYLTEGHKNLPTDTPLLHDLFSAAQLPLSTFPRIANDLRHPAGIYALFFDTHVESMRHERLDAGWPNPLALRLRYFTILPENP
jgi:prepilin-type N-terminal cleavage/methylation domain-containing protein